MKQKSTPTTHHFSWRRPAACVAALMSLISLAHAADFYIAPQGSDQNPGTKQKPFATLEAARDAIRALDKPAKADGVTVWIGSGTYALDQSFELDARDSGTEAGPIIYRAAEGASVSLMGGRKIPSSAFKPVTDPAIIDRLEPSAVGKVLQADLKALGITNFGQTDTRVTNQIVNGAMLSTPSAVPELFFNHEALPLSVWPNTGFAKYSKVIDKGSVPRFGDHSNQPGTIEYTGNRPERWTKAEHIFIQGYFAYDWFDDILKVATLDTEQKRITFTTPHMYGMSSNMRYRVLGLLEEIDQAGEWMIEHKTGTLYLYPPADMAKGEFALSVLETPLVRMTGTAHITLRGLTLETTRGLCVEILGGTDNLIAACTLRNNGGAGVVIQPIGFNTPDPGALHQFPVETGDALKDGRRNGVVGCDLYNIGTTGISMIGGNRQTLDPSGHYAINNDIHHYARLQRANQPAINMNGVGQHAAHNFIHDAPHVGLDLSGNDHIIEYNEFTRICRETSDVGAIYSGRNWTYRGNVLRYNYLHHIEGIKSYHGARVMYFDDAVSSSHIYGNVFQAVEKGIMINGGRDYMVENNLFVDIIKRSVTINDSAVLRSFKYMQPGADHRMHGKLKEVNHNQPPYSTRYPELVRILDEKPYNPVGNTVRNNILIRSPFFFGAGKSYAKAVDNLETKEDLVVIDAKTGKLKFKDLAAIQKQLPGFKPIPFEKIGLKTDEYRTALPPSASPIVTPSASLFRDAITINFELSAGDKSREDLVVRYTTDGSDPTPASPAANGPLVLRETAQVKARTFARDSGVQPSPLVVADYKKTDTLYLSIFPEADAIAHGGLKKNLNYAGTGYASLGGKRYYSSLMVCPPRSTKRAYVTYALEGLLKNASRFRAEVGIEDAVGSRGSVVFIVELQQQGTWTEAFKSPVVRGGQGSVSVDVDITGAEALRLVTTDGGDSIDSDHAVWADARVE